MPIQVPKSFLLLLMRKRRRARDCAWWYQVEPSHWQTELTCSPFSNAPQLKLHLHLLWQRLWFSLFAFRSSLREDQPTPILAALLLVQPKDASRSSFDEKIVSTRFYLEFVKLFCIRCRSSARHNVKMGTSQLKRYIILQVEFWTSRCYVVIDWIKSLF